jgi:small subunit ribosomal protein S15
MNIRLDMLDKVKKTSVVNSFALHPNDTGSAEVQVALLTERINYLHTHFKAFPKDVASKLGLMKLVNSRRKFLSYLKRNNVEKYEEMISRLGLRK